MSDDSAETLDSLSPPERREIARYIEIFKAEGFTKHWQVNEWIGRHDAWDNFPSIRSLNDHVAGKNILGIRPRHFALVCKLLDIDECEGSPLIEAKPC